MLSQVPAATIVKAFPAAILVLPLQAGGDYREGIPRCDLVIVSSVRKALERHRWRVVESVVRA
jgi:hypothetical protein